MKLNFVVLGICLVLLCSIVSATPDAYSSWVADGDHWNSSNNTYDLKMYNATGTHYYIATTTGADILVQAGGSSGAGGSTNNGAGGGSAGGTFVLLNYTTSIDQNITLIVGSKGSAVPADSNSNRGTNSSFDDNIAIRGGYSATPAGDGESGGSGGAAANSHVSGVDHYGGAGTPGQGKNGGDAIYRAGYKVPGPGGGGNSTAGTWANTVVTWDGGNGGDGYNATDFGLPSKIACGGAGGGIADTGGHPDSHGGTAVCGGGTGSEPTNLATASAATSYGSGGGGGAAYAAGADGGGAAGYDGVVIVRTLKQQTPVASFTPTGVINANNSVTQTFSDTSSGSPITWNWSYQGISGDNNTLTIWSTIQNPTGVFGIGNFSIKLNVTNSYGYNLSTQSTWINVTSNRSLTSDFTISNTSGIPPLLTHFTDTSTTNLATIDSWNWSFGDGNISSIQNPDHTFVNNGTYSVNLTITNISYSLASTKIQMVTVYNSPPVANFAASNLSGSPPLVVQFTDTSTGNNISIWNWSFGDGNISSLQNPLYTYDYIGDYQVNLTVTNDGGSSTKLQNITVAMFGAHFVANETVGAIPFPVAFTDTSIGNYDTWNWSVDDGTLHWYNKTVYADRNLEYTFNNVGSWRVNLSVQNISESGPIYSTSMNVTATNVPPVAAFIGYPSAGSTSTVFIFNDTSTGVVNTWNWSFGDGNYSSTQNATHTFPSNAVYNVNLTVSNDGGSSFVVHPFTISPFSVSTTISPSYGAIPLLVMFNETYSGLIPDSYYWEFGDGATSTDKNTTHTYTTTGTFNVNHRVVNDSTVIWSNTTNAVTTIAGYALPNFTSNVTSGDYPLSVQFTDTSTYVNATPFSWYWVFGDGFTSTLQNPSHIYSNVGTYSVNFTINTEYGSNSSLKTGYISVGGVAANGRQDVILINFHNITLYVKDASSGNLISYATVMDETGRELTSYGNGVFTGSYSTGQHTFIANATNYYTNRATYLVSGNLIQTIYLTQVATSVSTTWYTPKTIQISFTDVYGNQLTGAYVNARYNETTLPNGVSDLISNYGMNANIANEALNGTLLMSGTTDTSGEIVFTMLSTIKYDVVVTYGGQTNYYSIYPQNPQYQFKFITTVTSDNIWNDLYASGNTKVWATEPDPANVTFHWSFQDMTNLTTGIDYFLNDVDLNTIVYTTHVSSPIAGSIYQLNYTVPNVRGKNYIAYVNYTRNA